MRLATFIRHAMEDILAESLAYAGTIPTLSGSAVAILHSHLPIVLGTIAFDLEQPQSRDQSIEKSRGKSPLLQSETAAQSHGTYLARSGLDIEQVVAEYRVIRSCVLRLWAAAHPPDEHVIEDTTRFNEAVDQAVSESVAFHAAEVARWRSLFLGVLGHDLRGPLNSIVLTAELLARNGQAAELSSILVRAARSLTSLLDSLLQYNKLTPSVGMQIDRKAVDLGPECQDEVEILQRTFPERNIILKLTGDIEGLFDRSRIREALVNLVTNAAQHSPTATTITVTVLGLEKTIEISTENQAEPIPQEILDTLFEPLRRNANVADTSGGHLGLGLFVVREIARAHQGGVSVSMADGNIRFTMILPK